MCYQLLPLILAGAGKAINAKADQGALAAQDREAAANVARQAGLNREGDTKVSQAVSKIAASNPQEAIDQRRTAYLEALRRTQPEASAAMPATPGASERFAEDLNAADATAQTRGANEASTLANLEAPGVQRQAEGNLVAETGSDLGLLAGKSRSEDYLSKLRLARIRPSASLKAFGSILSGAGSGLAANGGTAPATVWDDGTKSTGFTAQQRRERWLGA